jgi:23S rRNA pseudouridine2605 synthase
MRINKYLADSGIGSRRKVEEYIASGLVKVNDKVISDFATQVNDGDVVKFKDKIVSPIESKVYIMLNKPSGYLTTVSDMYGRKTVMDLFKGIEVDRIYPIGRLDYDTEGLLLFTNDGAFANNVIHPRSSICKTYEVIVENPLSEKDKENLQSGMVIDGYKTTPAKLNDYKKLGNHKYMFKLTIFEGRNRQIRKMVEKVNNKVIYLKRLSIGKLTLGQLKVGQYRYLTVQETNKIFQK